MVVFLCDFGLIMSESGEPQIGQALHHCENLGDTKATQYAGLCVPLTTF